MESICDEIVRHITEVAAENSYGSNHLAGGFPSSSSKDFDDSFSVVARMIVNFKVDGNGRIWILWSNSIRLQNAPLDSGTCVTQTDSNSTADKASSEPLNMDAVVRLPSSVKLTQVPNHNAHLKLENKLPLASCPSCNERDTNEHFQPVPYKTVIRHFEKTLDMLESRSESHPSKIWPPEDRFIQAAGGVGFGPLLSQLELDRERTSNVSGLGSQETYEIPPVIRQIHSKLRVKGYRMYRSDPLFLHKTCHVCESCFLAYAKLTSTSFLMTRPIDPLGSDEDCHHNIKVNDKLKNAHSGDLKNNVNPKQNKSTPTHSFSADHHSTTSPITKDFGNAPAPVMPPAIIEPPQVRMELNFHEVSFPF